MLHLGQRDSDLAFRLWCARRLLVREFECFLLGTAIELPESGLLRIFAITDSIVEKRLSQLLICVFIRVLPQNIGHCRSDFQVQHGLFPARLVLILV